MITDPQSQIGPLPARSSPPTPISAPACNASRLALSWWGDAQAATQQYGRIAIRNTGNADRVLTGPIGLVGVDASGQPDTIDVAYPVAGGLVLTANAAAPAAESEPPIGEAVAMLSVGDSHVIANGPSAGADCPATAERTPAKFRLTFGADAIEIANAPGQTAQQKLRSCDSHLTVASLVTSSGN